MVIYGENLLRIKNEKLEKVKPNISGCINHGKAPLNTLKVR